MIVPDKTKVAKKKESERKASNEFTFLYVMLTTIEKPERKRKPKKKCRESLMIYTVISTMSSYSFSFRQIGGVKI